MGRAACPRNSVELGQVGQHVPEVARVEVTAVKQAAGVHAVEETRAVEGVITRATLHGVEVAAHVQAVPAVPAVDVVEAAVGKDVVPALAAVNVVAPTLALMESCPSPPWM